MQTSFLDARFPSIAAIVAEGFRAEGYAVTTGDTQDWGHRLTLSAPEIDGAVALFFGPLAETDDTPPGTRQLPYLLMWENSWRGAVSVPEDAAGEEMGRIVLRELLVEVARIFRTPRPRRDPDVGVGLLPPDHPGARSVDHEGSGAPGDEAPR